MSECCSGWRLWSRHAASCPRRNAPGVVPSDVGHLEVTIRSETTMDEKTRPRTHVTIKDLHTPGKSPLEGITIVDHVTDQHGRIVKDPRK